MASIIAIVAAATHYTYVECAYDGTIGVALTGRLGGFGVWSDSVPIEVSPVVGDRFNPYHVIAEHPEVNPRRDALSWHIPV